MRGFTGAFARARRLAVLLTALCVAVLPAVAARAQVQNEVQATSWPAAELAAPGRVVVTTDGPAGTAAVLAAAPGARTLTPGVVLAPAGDEAAQAARLAVLPGVRAAEPDWLLHPARVPGDAGYPEQWAHRRTGAPAGWDRRVDARAARVAVIDTGVRGDHPDLAGAVVEQVDVSTGVLAGPPRTGVDNDSCREGHGTWVAGVVGAAGDNGRDVAGVAWRATILDIAVASTRPGADCAAIPMSTIVAGIDYAVRGAGTPASVISISLGAYLSSCPTGMQTAVDRAWDAGALVVASSGNGELDPATAGRRAYPASCERVISVGATGPTDVRAPYSTRNGAVDLAAPGGDATLGSDAAILTTHREWATTPVRRVQGTSFAAPYVAGVAALVRAERPDLGPADVAALLTATARDLGVPGRDADSGAGLVRLDAALAAAAEAPATAPAPTPAPDPEPEPEPEPEAETEEPSVDRVAPGSGRTTAVEQAVAVSRSVFRSGQAAHAVLARADDYADALAGSALGMGRGPLLYAERAPALPAATRDELVRALPRGATVFLLGGSAALPAALEDELRELGFSPRRLAGASREETAATVARAVRAQLRAGGESGPERVLLATRGDWPDAVAGGSIAARFAAPVLLTPAGSLHPAARAVLAELRPAEVLVVGGTRAVADAVARDAAAAAGGGWRRLSGPARDATAVAVGQALDRMLAATGRSPRYAVAVNLRRADGFAHALSASVLAGARDALLVPVERSDGSELTGVTREWVAGSLGAPETDVLLAGAADVVAEPVGEEIAELMNQARQARQRSSS